MNKLIVVVAIILAFSIYVSAESPHQGSTVPATSVFEMVHGTQLTALTVRLNKITGEAWYMLDSGKKGGPAELSWVRIDPAPLGRAGLRPDAPNYKVDITGAGFSAVYIMNVNTGATWVLSGQPGPRTDPMLTWVPIAESK
jgi:hypothetical protein